MTVCNMSIEAGARAGMIAPDETTFEYLAGTPARAEGRSVGRGGRALAHVDDRSPARRYDRTIVLDASTLAPMITYGTNPGMGMAIDDAGPDPAHVARRVGAARAREGAHVHGARRRGEPLLGKPVDVVFLGSCTNSRISDLRLAAGVMRGQARGLEGAHARRARLAAGEASGGGRGARRDLHATRAPSGARRAARCASR